jgi:hypothetical protein
MNQRDRVLRALRMHDTITPLDFMQADTIDGGAQIFRLAARVEELRARGYAIENVGGRYARYRLVRDLEHQAPPACQCGCGDPVNSRVKASDATRGIVAGEWRRYLPGHNGRKSPVEYIEDENGCWIWQRAINRHGYGHIQIDRKTCAAHRVYYERAKGPIPDGLVIDHICRVRACVNPDHMEAVTVTENTRRGANTKLTAAQVDQVRASGASAYELADRFGCCPDVIWNLRSGKTWSHDHRVSSRDAVDSGAASAASGEPLLQGTCPTSPSEVGASHPDSTGQVPQLFDDEPVRQGPRMYREAA